VSTAETTLPGRLGLRRRAPMLYKRLMRGSVIFTINGRILNCWRHSFYPGIASPDLQLIGSASSASVGAIDAPESQASLNKEGSAQERGEVSASGKMPRAPWVTGSFDHAILPMPPVSAPFLLRVTLILRIA
jgi:hypothetical protein